MKSKQASEAEKKQEALQEQRRKLMAQVVRSADHIDTLEEGYRLRLAHKHTDLVMQLEQAERACCQFLNFGVEFPAGLDTINLTITGPVGTREYLDQLVAKKK